MMMMMMEKKKSSLLKGKQKNTSIPPIRSKICKDKRTRQKSLKAANYHDFHRESDAVMHDIDSSDDCHWGETETVMDDEGVYTFGNNIIMDYECDDEEGYPHSDSDCDNDTEKNYTVLSEDDIRGRQEEDISEVSSVLSISPWEASILLRHYQWSISNLHDAWFANEEKVRMAVGLLEKPVIQYPDDKKLTCQICFDKHRRHQMRAASCGHLFCSSCWNIYISTSINDGPGCLMLRCPDPSCGAAVGQEMINVLVSDEAKEKYDRYLLRSYVEASKKTKWCPAPGCGHAVEFVPGSGSYDVSCKCTHSFCWNCTEEVHRPVECDIVAKWILKNSAESENTTWILANSKPCPKCKRPIEKRDGCMHMTCTPPCRFEFCWLCLGSWSDHGGNTGGFYACNRYEIARKEGKFDQTEKRREMAKRSLERYTHYYERWAANEKSKVKAMKDLQEMQTLHFEKLGSDYGQFEPQLIKEAWLQIIKCRRVLKWTYAYGYYLLEHEETKMQFFEYLQGEAESGLERLHHCAEKDLKPFIEGKSQDNFIKFRIKLSGLITVTRNYFENLVRALENGLVDVETVDACNKSGNSRASVEMKLKKNGRTKRTTSRSSDDGQTHHGQQQRSWSCEHCTYLNQESSTICQICNQHRAGSWSCGWCTYFNNVSATICLMCNQRR